MLATRQLARAAVVGVALLAFFIMVGLIVVTPETAALSIGSQPEPSLIRIPVAMLRIAALFAAFGSMLFAVTSMSDDEYQHQFFRPSSTSPPLASNPKIWVTRSGFTRLG
jgi:hypothetical protein